MPFGNPQCEKVAALSLCSSFRKNMQIQTLRSHFDIKCEHGRRTRFADTKIFAPCNAPRDSTNFKQDGKQKPLLPPPAARVGYA
jgi:hypothetical protein